jgi:protein SCO1/2
MRRLSLIALAAGILLAACSEPVRFKSTDVSGADWGRDFALTDHHGQLRRLADFRGKAVVLFFAYTKCPHICPTTLTAMRDAAKLLGEDANRVQVLLVTVDPERDTQAVLADYVPRFHPGFIGLRGDAATTAAVARDFKVFYTKQPGSAPGDYGIDHSTSSYAFDPQGRLRLVIRYGETSENIAADLRLLLAGK